MLLIFSTETSYRLQYICQFLFKEQMGLTYALTLDAESFEAHTGPKINYSLQNFNQQGFSIKNHLLLFEKDIKFQEINCFENEGYTALFKTSGDDFGFDIFAASFYLLTRYEEYLPHKADMYGRYAHENAIAFRENFLNLPLINIWINDFVKKLALFFPGLKPMKPAFSYLPTYDIDIAWSYKHKGLLRNFGGFISNPGAERLLVLSGVKSDPYDAYREMDALHVQYDLKPVYFFLVATEKSKYDKNLSPYSHAMWQLMKRHSKKYSVGLHPSFASFEKPVLVGKEKKILETATGIRVVSSRQHYIKFSLPDTFRELVKAGIKHDFSMGYGSINGFRASFAGSFLWYDLGADKISSLRLHPFCFMDANSFYEQAQTAEASFEEMMHYKNVCMQTGGQMITIFHNDFLGTAKKLAGWNEMYRRFISLLPQ